MPPKNKLDLKKIEADRLSGFLQELLREEENKYCADCEAKQPRWASWNLGVFLCIRCAGLHRNLGVHISKVKSVNLDTWTAEQVQSMRVMGNSKAKAVYESELPQMFRRPQNDQTLETFIRAKYESRRYIMRDWVPPSVKAADLPADLGTEKSTEKCGTSNLSSNIIAKPKTIQTVSERSSSTIVNQKSNIVDLFDLQTSSEPNGELFSIDNKFSSSGENNLDELFGPIVSAPIATESKAASICVANDVAKPLPENNALEINFFDNVVVAGSVVNAQEDILDSHIPANEITAINFNSDVPDIKKSNSDILALFGNGTSRLYSSANQLPSSQFHFGSGISVPQQQPKHFTTSSGVNVTSDCSLTNTGVNRPPHSLLCNHGTQNLNTNQGALNFDNKFCGASVDNLAFSSQLPLNLASFNGLSGISSISNATSGVGGSPTNGSCSGITSSGLDDLFGQFKL